MVSHPGVLNERNVRFIYAFDHAYACEVDFRRPVQALIPGVQGRILAVLAETTADLNLRTIARLSGVSAAQASRVLQSLVGLGVVSRREAPPSALFRLVDDHVAGRTVRALTRAREIVLDDLGDRAKGLSPQPVSVVIFGSFARGEAVDHSDLDAVVVRPDGISEDHEGWGRAIEEWRLFARRLTGDRIEILEVAERDVGRLLRSRKPLWRDVLRDGVVVHGLSLIELQGRRSA